MKIKRTEDQRAAASVLLTRENKIIKEGTGWEVLGRKKRGEEKREREKKKTKPKPNKQTHKKREGRR